MSATNGDHEFVQIFDTYVNQCFHLRFNQLNSACYAIYCVSYFCVIYWIFILCVRVCVHVHVHMK